MAKDADSAGAPAVMSVPNDDPMPAAKPMPESTDEAPLFEAYRFAGLERFRCLFPVKRLGGAGEYVLPCRLDFSSHDALMAHLRDDH